MKLSDRTYIIILIAMIVGLSAMAYWHFQKVQRPLEIEPPKFELPAINFDFDQVNWADFEMPITDFDWKNGLSSESEDGKEWISPDGRLRLAYSNNWVMMEKALLEAGAIIGTMLLEEETLFVAYHPEVTNGGIPTLTVSQIDPEKTLEEITDSIGQNIERGGGEKEIVVLETKKGYADLEMVLKYPGYLDFYSKGIIIFTEEKTYLIFLTVPKQAWSQFEEEAKKILNSVKLLE
jgi:hypothetical protein